MRKTWCVVCALAVLLGAGGRLWSGDESAARAVIAKAIEALGGEGKIGKFNAVVMKGTGKFYGMGDEGVPFTGEWDAQGADQMRIRLEGKAMDQTFVLTKVVNGDKGWTKLNKDKASPMPRDVLAEEKEQMYGTWVATLTPLKAKGFKLSSLADTKVEGRPAAGVRVSHAGRRDVSLYFDKKTYLLLKSAMTVKNVEDGSNKEMLQEIYYGGYKEFGGAQYPTKMSMRRDGKRYVEGELTEVRPAAKLDAKVFAEP
jgi:hypothetical protein